MEDVAKEKYAGVLPYHVDRAGRVWLLLGQERGGQDRGLWSDFGGIVERGESLIEAAAREGYEETMGMLGSAPQLQQALSERRSFPRKSTVERHFLLHLKHMDERLPAYFKRFYHYSQTCTLLLNRHRSNYLPGADCGCWEKSEIKWVPLNNITVPLRKYFESNLQRAIEANLFPK